MYSRRPLVRCRQLSTREETTVIVVDSDRFMRRALKMQLKLAGFNVLLFDSAESLLESSLLTKNACLLLDMHLPGINCVELCRKLAASGRQPSTILMSASDDELTHRIVTEAKAVAVLSKPFDEEALLGAIRKALLKPPNLSP